MFLASVISSIFTLPFDNIRTRIMNAHSQVDRNRLNYNGYIDVIFKALAVESNPRGLYAGFYSWVLATYVYSWLTIGITETFTDSWKRKQGLL